MESIRNYTPEEYEIIVIDNGSTDLTRTYLRIQPDVKLICNEYNRGFAAGCNQGLEIATGDHILFLNNDTVVTPNWLTSMMKVLHSSSDIGMVGPLTNYASGHQIIPVTYSDLLDLNAFAHQHALRSGGSSTEVRRLIGFCILVKRSMLDEIGGFDESFGLGNLEDDDLCLRAARAGYRLFIANDCFIHHVGHATMSQVQEDRGQHLIRVNRFRAKAKWGGDIFDIIYKADIQLTCCLLLRTSSSIQVTIASIKEIADEIIIIDQLEHAQESLVATCDRYIRVNRDYTVQQLYRQGIEEASKSYIMFLEDGEYVLDADRRKLRALKRTLSPEVQAVTMICSHVDTNEKGLYTRLVHHKYPLSEVDESQLEGTEVMKSDIELLRVLASE